MSITGDAHHADLMLILVDGDKHDGICSFTFCIRTSQYKCADSVSAGTSTGSLADRLTSKPHDHSDQCRKQEQDPQNGMMPFFSPLDFLRDLRSGRRDRRSVSAAHVRLALSGLRDRPGYCSGWGGTVGSSLLLGTSMMDDAALPQSQYAVFNRAAGEKRHVTYPKWGHERVNDFEDALMAYLVAPWDACPGGDRGGAGPGGGGGEARGGEACDGVAGGIG